MSSSRIGQVKNAETGHEEWTSRIFEMMFTGAGKSVVELLTGLKDAHRRWQLLQYAHPQRDFGRQRTVMS